ncbi:MAG: hypothetical protein ABSF14_03175 [Terriglobia bacterium]|jgi:hypothetical protein
MRKAILAIILGLVVLCPAFAQGSAIPKGSKLYIDLQDEFGNALVTAIEKKAVPVTVVSSPADADFVLIAKKESQLRYQGKGHDSVIIVNAKDQTIVWGYNFCLDPTLSFGYMWHNHPEQHLQLRIAGTIAKHLKEKIEEQ